APTEPKPRFSQGNIIRLICRNLVSPGTARQPFGAQKRPAPPKRRRRQSRRRSTHAIAVAAPPAPAAVIRPRLIGVAVVGWRVAAVVGRRVAVAVGGVGRVRRVISAVIPAAIGWACK